MSILRSKTLGEKLSIDVMKQVRDTSAASGGGTSSTDHSLTEVLTMRHKIIAMRRMAVTMEVMQKVTDIEVEAAGETNGFKDALRDRELEMMMSFSNREI